MTRFSWWAFRCDLRELCGHPVSDEEARAVRRWINGHHTIQEQRCSEEMSDDRRKRVEARERGIESRLTDFFGEVIRFEGDPRGGTVKFHLESEERFAYFGKDWGGDYIYTGE